MSQITIIALAGKAGAGKDTILRYLCDNYDVHEVVSCTTRPKREGEIDGVNYHFLSVEEFAEKVMSMDMIEASEFNGWFYGTDFGALSEDKINVCVLNPNGIDVLSDCRDIKIMPFLVDASDKTRLLRQLNRENCPDVHEVIRRFKADEEDFDVLFGEETAKYGLIQNEDGMFPHNAEILAKMLNLGKNK